MLRGDSSVGCDVHLASHVVPHQVAPVTIIRLLEIICNLSLNILSRDTVTILIILNLVTGYTLLNHKYK